MIPSRVLLARHGETEWNAVGRIQGQADPGLAESGRRQAEALARRLARAGLGGIVSSDLRRARETAEVVATAAGLPVRLDPGFREQHLGEWEGRTFQEVAALFPDLGRRFRSREPEFRPPGGESREELQARAVAALDRHAPAPGAPPLLVVAHGGVVQSLVYAILGLPLASPRRFRLPNAGLTVVEREKGTWTLSTLNDIAHLDGLTEGFPFE